MQISLRIVGVTGILLEIVGIIVLGLEPILSPAIYVIGLTIIIFYAYNLNLIEPRLTRYYKYILYSSLTLLVSLAVYTVLSALYPRPYEPLYMLLMVTGVLVSSIIYGLAYISAFIHMDLPLRTFILGIIYCLVGVANLFTPLIGTLTTHIPFLIIVAVLIKALEGWIIARHPDTRITRPIIRNIGGAILFCLVSILIISSLIATTNSMIYVGDRRIDFVHTNTVGNTNTITYILYIGVNTYHLLVNKGFTYKSVSFSPPATLTRLNGFYQPLFKGYTTYYGTVAPEIIYYHLHVSLDYDPRDLPGIGYTVLIASSSIEDGPSYSIRMGKIIEPLNIRLRIPSGNYVVSARLAVKGDIIGEVELITGNGTIEILPGKQYLIRTSTVSIIIKPVNTDELGDQKRVMIAGLSITLYKMNAEPVPGILILHYRCPMNYMIPLGAALIVDAIR